jgi:N-glycosylase/DNA lyase
MPQTFFLDTPENFSFRHTLNSHGWRDLLPFESNAENTGFSYVFTDEQSKNPILATVEESDGKLKVEILGDKINRTFQEKILRDVRHILRLDDDLSEFYEIIESEKELAWISKQNAGRLLRSPTVFEDLVKTICTTNCSWALTKNMVTNLTEKLGEKTADGKFSFPNAEAMASVSAEFYKTEIRAGYRSTYFAELAEKVASGAINPENWLDTDLPTKELKKEIKQIKGVGDYAAENLLKLVGHYDGLALDSWVRAQFYRKHNGGEICADKDIESFYGRFGSWRGLAIWCDVTEKWFIKT